MIIPCPKCHHPMTRIISVSMAFPASVKAITKKAIQSKDANIIAADWGKSTLFCPECGYDPDLEKKFKLANHRMGSMSANTPTFTIETIREQVQALKNAESALENHRKRYQSIRGTVGRELEANATNAWIDLLGYLGEKFAFLLEHIDRLQEVEWMYKDSSK